MALVNKPGFWKKSTASFKGIIFTALCSMIMLSNIAVAQPDVPVKTYLSDSYYEEDGLGSNLVYKIGQSADGLMWFVTQRGTSTFDGARWNSYDFDVSANLAVRVNLTALQRGDMVLTSLSAQKSHFMIFQDEQQIPLPAPPDFRIQEDNRWLYAQVGATEHQPDRYLISLVSEGHLYLYNSSDSLWQTFPMPAEINWRKIGSIHFYENKIMLLAQDGLAAFDIGKQEFNIQPVPEIAGRPVIEAAISRNKKGIYLLGDNYIGYYHNGKYETVLEDIYSSSPSYSGFHNILIDRHDRIFFNHHSSIFKYNLRTKALESFKLDGASDDIPTDMYEDMEGNIWFSTLRGVKKVSNFGFYSLGESTNSFSSEVSTITSIDSSVVLGNNYSISILRKNKLLTFPLASTDYRINKNNRIIDGTTSPDGKVYLAANNLGVGILHPNDTLEWLPPAEDELITAVAYHQGKLLASSHKGTLYHVQDGRYIPIWTEKFLYIRKIISRNNELYILSNYGLYVLNDAGTTKIKGENLQEQSLYSYLEWNGRQFLGSMGGLCELKNGQIRKVTEDSLQLERPVYAMLEDTKGRLWLGTDKGIFLTHQGKLINHKSENGLNGKEINRSAFQVMPDGSIWIGTDQGLSVYNPEDDIVPDIIPKVRIKQLIAEGHVLNSKEVQRLNYDHNNLEFLFQPISFYQPDNNNYRYKLEGLDKNWIYSGNHLTNQVRYTNLSPGSYTFVIQARTGNGPWSEPARSSLIHIQLPYYQTWWFILLTLAGIGSIGYMAHALMTHKQNEIRLRQAIEEKKAEVEESEKRFRAVWEGTDTSFVLSNRHGKILMANPSFCRLMRVSVEYACQNHLASLLPDSSLHGDRLRQIYEQKAVYRDQVITSLQYQTRYLTVTITFVNHQLHDEQLMLIGFRDETEQKRAEANNARLNEELLRQNIALIKKEEELANYNHELLQQREELEQALRAVEERNYQLDQFVYKTSHDLRAPISSALGLINIIRMDSDYNRWPQYLELIDGSLKKQDAFIKAMLSFSKTTRSTNKAEQIDFRELISQCLEELQDLQGFVEVEQLIQVYQQEELFYSDRMKLYIILSNIISNSIKYRDTFKKSFLQVEVRPGTEGAEIVISDNGIGIASQYQNQIFDMFFRATERSDGSGLGLYIVKQTVEKLQGHIITHSELGKGSSFRIFIPNQYMRSDHDILVDHERDRL